MKPIKFIVAFLIMFFFMPAISKAQDFEWIKEMNIKAEMDPSGFRVMLASRFQIGDVNIQTVISNVEKPADGYMILRLAEMSKQSPEFVIKKYKAKKNKGWGEIAKSLGIKPGSQGFHALKNGHDLYNDKNNKPNKGKNKNK